MASPEENWSASVLASGTSLPLPTVAKLMKLLAKGNIVQAQRGASGGYKVARNIASLSIVRVIEAVDGPIGLTECAGKAAGKRVCDCVVGEKACPVRESWQRVNHAIMAALEDVKLSEFAAQSCC